MERLTDPGGHVNDAYSDALFASCVKAAERNAGTQCNTLSEGAFATD